MSLAEQPQPPGELPVPRQEQPEQLTVRETCTRLTVEELKTLLGLIHGSFWVPARSRSELSARGLTLLRETAASYAASLRSPTRQ